MINRHNASESRPEIDRVFDDLVCAVSAKLEAGEPVDLGQLAVEHPDDVDRLRKLLPTLLAIAELGRSDSALHDALSEPAERVSWEAGVLGDYRMTRALGRGGMGVVYEAEQMSLGRHVALKILPFAALLNEHQLRRFQTEATAVPPVTYHLTWIGGGLGTGLNTGFGGTRSESFALKNDASGNPIALGISTDAAGNDVAKEKSYRLKLYTPGSVPGASPDRSRNLAATCPN